MLLSAATTGAYDGEGNRVAQQATSGATTTTTDYIAGGLEEVTGGVLTKYYSVPGVGTAVNVGGTLSYLVSDGLNSVSEALSATGNVISTQLYSPYGGVRYSSGVLPTAKGYTGQVADATTGLDYDHARYYDPVLGQFASADTDAKGGLNRYGYVAGNPETATDPSGHRCTVGDCAGGSNGGITSGDGDISYCHRHLCGTGGGNNGGGSSAAGSSSGSGTGGHHQGSGGTCTGCMSNGSTNDSCDITTAACANAMQAKGDATATKDGFGAFALLFAGFATPAGIAAMNIKAFAAMVQKYLLKEFAAGFLAGAEMMAALGFALFLWESSHDVTWFMNKSNVDDFFTHAEGIVVTVGLVLLSVTLFGAATGAEFSPAFWGLLVSGTIATVPLLNKVMDAKDQQMADYAGGQPIALIETPCGNPFGCNAV